MDNSNQIIIYQSEDGETRIDVKFTGETVCVFLSKGNFLFLTLQH